MEIAALSLILLTVLIVLGVPVAMSFGAAVVLLVFWYHIDPGSVMSIAFYKVKSLVVISVPLFILVGAIMAQTSLSLRLVDFVQAFVGRMRSSLGTITIVTCALFGSIGGSCSAAVAAIGPTMIPRMEERGYSRGHATALIACASILGQLIPPSIPMIFFALTTLQSIPGCWLSTVGPGILSIITLSVVNYFMARYIPASAIRPRTDFWELTKFRAKATYKGLPTLILPVILFGGIYSGTFTPTESAAIAVFYLLIISRFTDKNLKGNDYVKIFVSSSTTTGILIIMLMFVFILSRSLTLEQIPQVIASRLIAFSSNKYIILLLINIFLLIIGMIMDDMSGTLLAAMLLFPVTQSIGVHPLHFAAIVGTNLGLGNVTPPTAPILYLAGRVGNCTMDKYIKPALIFMGPGLLPVVFITTYWPDISLFLPRLLGFA